MFVGSRTWPVLYSGTHALLIIVSVLCRTFVEENEGVHELQVYTVLETVAMLSPSTVSRLVPELSLGLRHTEQRRGLGRDISLR